MAGAECRPPSPETRLALEDTMTRLEETVDTVHIRSVLARFAISEHDARYLEVEAWTKQVGSRPIVPYLGFCFFDGMCEWPVSIGTSETLEHAEMVGLGVDAMAAAAPDPQQREWLLEAWNVAQRVDGADITPQVDALLADEGPTPFPVYDFTKGDVVKIFTDGAFLVARWVRANKAFLDEAPDGVDRNLYIVGPNSGPEIWYMRGFNKDEFLQIHPRRGRNFPDPAIMPMVEKVLFLGTPDRKRILQGPGHVIREIEEIVEDITKATKSGQSKVTDKKLQQLDAAFQESLAKMPDVDR